MNRRSFLTGLAGILAAGAAPSIVSAGNIMRIKPILLPPDYTDVMPSAREIVDSITLHVGENHGFKPGDQIEVFSHGNGDWYEVMRCINGDIALDPGRVYRVDRPIDIGAGQRLRGGHSTIEALPTSFDWSRRAVVNGTATSGCDDLTISMGPLNIENRTPHKLSIVAQASRALVR